MALVLVLLAGGPRAPSWPPAPPAARAPPTSGPTRRSPPASPAAPTVTAPRAWRARCTGRRARPCCSARRPAGSAGRRRLVPWVQALLGMALIASASASRDRGRTARGARGGGARRRLPAADLARGHAALRTARRAAARRRGAGAGLGAARGTGSLASPSPAPARRRRAHPHGPPLRPAAGRQRPGAPAVARRRRPAGAGGRRHAAGRLPRRAGAVGRLRLGPRRSPRARHRGLRAGAVRRHLPARRWQHPGHEARARRRHARALPGAALDARRAPRRQRGARRRRRAPPRARASPRRSSARAGRTCAATRSASRSPSRA